jgi:hypothetical protein
MTAGKRTQRTEWRGDVFAADLSSVRHRLAAARPVAYDLPHTLTVFLQPEGKDLDVEKTLRLRGYCELPDFSPAAVMESIARGLDGKLQIKERSGAFTEVARGLVMLAGEPKSRPSEGIWNLKLAGQFYRARSVRVARRSHFELDLPGETARLTLDSQRLLFRLGRGSARFLGDMGPRVEIKAGSASSARLVQSAIDPDAVLRRLPYHSLELLFQDQLRRTIDPSTLTGYPEIESKFDAARTPMRTLPGRLEKWIASVSGTMLLPFPHRIVRLRRYHFCDTAGTGEQRTVVETVAGRLSAKVKRNAAASGPVLVRDTQASRTTDIDGDGGPVDDFLRVRGWTRVNRMDKMQTKIPFRLPNGNCYQASIDDCVDVHGRRLRQVELEYIGSPGARPSVDEICAELARLAGSIGLPPAGTSKFDYFVRNAPRISSITA